MSLRRRWRARRPSDQARAEGSAGSASVPVETGPTATYAAVLDGRHLWLGVDRPGAPALRDPATGQVVVVASEPSDPVDPGRSPAVLLLPGPEHAELEAVLVAADRGTVTTVLAGPTSDGRVPLAPGGRHRWATYRAEDGSLRLRAEQVPGALELAEVSTRPGAVLLRCEPPAPLALLAAPDAPGGGVPAVLGTEGEGQDRTVVTTADASALPDGRVVVVAAEDHRAVRRRADSLAAPGRAAPLPDLLDDDGFPVLRLRWSPEGLLEAVVPAREPAEELAR